MSGEREPGAAAPRSTVSDRSDVAIIGAGIIGLATALRLLERKPDLRVFLLEKEATVASGQTGHNSGVLHAGLYYQPGSLKAQLCREGKADLEVYCEAHGLTVERTGKLVLALDDSETGRFEALKRRALANEVPGLEEVGPERIRELEPHAVGIKALWSPGTGIVDFAAVARAFAHDVVARGGVIETRREVESISRRGDEMVIGTSRGALLARRVIACAGLQADRVAAMTDPEDLDGPRIVPFRGDYYTLRPEAAHLVRGLIYPVPDPRLPFLGAHLTKRLDGSVLAGPNAVLATAREGYRRRDVSVHDLVETVAYPGLPQAGTPVLAGRRGGDVARLVQARVPCRPAPVRACPELGASRLRSLGRSCPGPAAGRLAGRRLPAGRLGPCPACLQCALAGGHLGAGHRPCPRGRGHRALRPIVRPWFGLEFGCL